MFYEIFGNPVFIATKPRNRFKLLIAHISFDDHITCSTPWQHDRFAAFRKIFKGFNKNCGKFLVPNDYLRMKLFILRERKSVSNNLIGANQASMECCINQKTLSAIHLPFQLLCILLIQKQSRHLTILLGRHKQ